MLRNTLLSVILLCLIASHAQAGVEIVAAGMSMLDPQNSVALDYSTGVDLQCRFETNTDNLQVVGSLGFHSYETNQFMLDGRPLGGAIDNMPIGIGLLYIVPIDTTTQLTVETGVQYNINDADVSRQLTDPNSMDYVQVDNSWTCRFGVNLEKVVRTTAWSRTSLLLGIGYQWDISSTPNATIRGIDMGMDNSLEGMLFRVGIVVKY